MALSHAWDETPQDIRFGRLAKTIYPLVAKTDPAASKQFAGVLQLIDHQIDLSWGVRTRTPEGASFVALNRGHLHLQPRFLLTANASCIQTALTLSEEQLSTPKILGILDKIKVLVLGLQSDLASSNVLHGKLGRGLSYRIVRTPLVIMPFSAKGQNHEYASTRCVFRLRIANDEAMFNFYCWSSTNKLNVCLSFLCPTVPPFA